MKADLEAAAAFDYDSEFWRAVEDDHGLDRDYDDAYETDHDIWTGDHDTGR